MSTYSHYKSLDNESSRGTMLDTRKVNSAFRRIVMAKMYHVLGLATGIVLCCLLSAPSQGAEGQDDKAQCAAQLKKLHQAIQDYRREHKAMPNWLSDLSPKFI